ncbi:MAG: iron-containing alcohol dehydrogenase [Chloroflexi bacterium]|nr:iron-containing alcohol dehydrogenase [Chloroflexota bacterium]
MQTFFLPTQVTTGPGCFAQLGKLAAGYGQRALLVCDKRLAEQTDVVARASELLAAAGVALTVYSDVAREPELPVVAEGIQRANAADAQVVIGIGGGSAMDTAKAIAGLCKLPGSVLEYHQGRKLEGPGLPLVTVPTTAGTGAEVTKNAVLIDPATKVKQSIRDDRWFARAALVDPELTVSMPPAVTASTGADALCQAIESYTSIGAGPLSDALAMRAIALIGANLGQAYRHGDDLAAREAMSMGSLMAGIAMATARLGGVHGMAHPLGSHYAIPHGVICGLLLPYTMAYNLPAAADKYAVVARLMGSDTAGLTPPQAAQHAVDVVRDLVTCIGVPMRLRAFGVTEDALGPIIDESLTQSSLHHNPRKLEAEDVRAILMAAL